MKKFKPSVFPFLALLNTILYIAERISSNILNQTDIILCSVVSIGCIGYLVLYTVKYFKKIKYMTK